MQTETENHAGFGNLESMPVSPAMNGKPVRVPIKQQRRRDTQKAVGGDSSTPTGTDVAKELKESIALPPIPTQTKGGRVPFDILSEWLNALTQDQWRRITVYQYRLFPHIDLKRKNPDANTSIDCIGSGPITRETVTAIHGGGKYKFIVNDNMSQQGTNTLMWCNDLDISWTDYPPIIADLETVLLTATEQSKNAPFWNYYQAQGKLGGKKEEPAPVARPQSETVGLVRELLPLLRQEKQPDNSAAMFSQFVTAMTQMNDPGKQLGMIAEFSKLAKGDSPGITVLDMMALQQKSFDAQLALMREQNQAKPVQKDPIEELDRIVNVAEKLGFSRGGGETDGGGGGWVATLTQGILSNLPQLITIIGSVMAATQSPANAAQLAQGLQEAGIGGQPGVLSGPPASDGTTGGGSQQVAMLPPVQPSPVATPAPNPNPTAIEREDMIEQMKMQYVTGLLGQVARVIQNKFDEGGVEFALWIVDSYGEDDYYQVAAFGPDKLYACAVNVPALKALIDLHSEAKVRLWLTALCDIDKVKSELEDDDDDTTEDVSNSTDVALNGNTITLKPKKQLS